MAAIDLDRIKDQGKRFVDGFTPGQKAMTILGVIAVVIAGMAFSKWSSTTDYAPLYTSLSGADAGKVTQALDSAGVKWKLADGGASVLVPADMVYKERVALSTQGLPSSGDGLALLDKEGITASEFVQRVDYQRAMQGELQKTIQAISGVASATVNLTIPPDQVFAGATADSPSAAVLVQPSGGALSSDKVQAIVNLVASSIPNMTPDDVTVADSNGNVLSAPGMDLSSSQGLEAQSAFDSSLGTTVSNYLAVALGPNHAAVHVQTDMNFDKTKRTSLTTSAPKDKNGKAAPLASSETKTSEKFTGAAAAAAGNLGITGTPAAGTGSTPESYSKSQSQTTNALNQVEEEVQQAPGSINKLSVAVLLDSSAVKPSDVANWTKQIQTAVGYDAKRGDSVQVTTVPFSAEAQKVAKQQLSAAKGASGGGMMDLVRTVVTLAIVALVLFFAWRAIKKAEANRVPLRVPLDLRELEVAEARALGPASATPRMMGELDRAALQPALDSGPDGELTDLIEHQPDEVAQTLRSWLADRRA
jgi:flagellar M-ring protein FliF